MPKIGRNDPCHCGSGKKYKNCHLPIDEAEQAEQRKLREAQDSLLGKLGAAAEAVPDQATAAFLRFWNEKYTLDQMAGIDHVEDRGAERFLSWFIFSVPLDNGKTLVEQIAAGEHATELNSYEARLLPTWVDVRLGAYLVDQVRKGQGFTARDLFDQQTFEVEDHAASRSLGLGDVLVTMLLPTATKNWNIAGAAAHLTPDTAERLREFAELHLADLQRDQPEASWSDLRRQRGEVLNHFVMQLPVEAADPSLLEKIVMQTRVALQMTGESLGLVKSPDTTQDEA